VVVEHGQHAAHIKSGCLHALLLSFQPGDFAAPASTQRCDASGRPDCLSLAGLQQRDSRALAWRCVCLMIMVDALRAIVPELGRGLKHKHRPSRDDNRSNNGN
jgi:hypothetical protein